MDSQHSQMVAPEGAVVIGINEYDSPQIRNLRGCVADALAIAELLQAHFGMKATQIRLLTSPLVTQASERPTRATIIAAFRDFLCEVPPHSEVLFYYSGHGSTSFVAPEIAFGEREAESFVPCDARSGDVHDLLDRELRLLASELAERQIRLTVIADACHAGGTFRNGRRQQASDSNDEPVPRLTPRSHTRRTLDSLLLPQDGGLAELSQRLTALYEQPLPNYTLLAGAQGSQKSYEVPIVEGEQRSWRGAMTWALIKALHHAGGPLSYRELVRIVRACLPSHPARDQQYPDLSGEEDRWLFMAESGHRPRPLFVVQKVESDVIHLDGGTLDGLEVGSELTCFTDWSLESSQGHWRVRDCFARESVAEPLDGAPLPGPGQPLQLDALNKRTVRFHPGTEMVASLWRGEPLKPTKGSEQAWRREARQPTYLAESFSSEADYHVRLEEARIVLRRHDGSVVPLPGLQNSQIGRLLDRVACYEDWVSWIVPDDETLEIQIQLGETGNGEFEIRAWQQWGGRAVPVAFGAQTPPLAKGVTFINLGNQSDRELYVNLYRLEPEHFYVERLWPGDGTGELMPGAAQDVRYVHTQAGHLHLKLILSSTPLEGSRWPCGRSIRQPTRGGVFAPPVEAQLEGARVEWITIGGSSS